LRGDKTFSRREKVRPEAGVEGLRGGGIDRSGAFFVDERGDYQRSQRHRIPRT
jgi:hypothetical protein